MEIKLIPKAVLMAFPNLIDCLINMYVSRRMLTMMPLSIAKAKIIMTETPLSCIRAMVPKSPIAQPIKHHLVLLALVRQVCLQDQKLSLIV
jgi:hypothetical protein